jgi:hypothetical protein
MAIILIWCITFKIKPQKAASGFCGFYKRCSAVADSMRLFLILFLRLRLLCDFFLIYLCGCDFFATFLKYISAVASFVRFFFSAALRLRFIATFTASGSAIVAFAVSAHIPDPIPGSPRNTSSAKWIPAPEYARPTYSREDCSSVEPALSLYVVFC